MPPIFLPLARKHAGMDLLKYSARGAAGDLNWRTYVAVCLNARRVAVAELLLEGSQTPFSTYTGHSGAAWLHFLQQAPDDQRLTAKGDGLFDAVAGGHLALAETIARHTPSQHNPKFEYEEDYLYIRLVAEILLGVADAEALQDLLTEWENYLDGTPDFRFDFIALLLGEDLDELAEGLADACDAMRDWLDERVERNLLMAEDEATLCHISTEVLTWIFLAERRGITPDLDYPLAPSLARVRKAVTPPLDGWRTIADVFTSGE